MSKERTGGGSVESFSSRWGLILAALGMAVGTGNVWRFPRIAAQNGGGSFLITWCIFLFLWSIPLLMVEFAMGKHARRGPVGAFCEIMGKKSAFLGAFVAFCSMAIMFYYSVVMGWCVRYFLLAVAGGLSGLEPEEGIRLFQESCSGLLPLLFHVLSMGIACGVVGWGIVRGIERGNRIMIPVLGFLLFLCAAWALTRPGALRGLAYFFTPKLDLLLRPKVWLEGLSQSAWSTGAGWGLILTYGIYMKKREDIVLNSFTTGLGNNSASLLAGILIFTTVFSLAGAFQQDPVTLLQSSGRASTGLTFEWLPALFNQMPAGRLVAIAFFLCLSMAALSSLLSMVELTTRTFMDFGVRRRKGVVLSFLFGTFLGAPSALALGFLENQDWAWGLGLMASGLFMALAVKRFGVDSFRQELINRAGSDIRVGRWFNAVVGFLIPLQFLCLIVWWTIQSAGWERAWWNPLAKFSIATCAVQWGAVLLVFFFLNRFLARAARREEKERG